MPTPFDSIEDAIRDIKKGKFVILVDDEDRENEGDLVIAAEKVTPHAINFMARHARGLICLALTPERVEELQLPQQAVENTATFGTAFTVSIDARKDITTGISAADRATTIHVAIDPQSKAERSGAARTYFPIEGPKGRRVEACRADRRVGRSGQVGRAAACRRHLRDHERRRHDGAGAGADQVRQGAQTQDGDGQSARSNTACAGKRL